MGFFKKIKKKFKKAVTRDIKFTTAIVTNPKSVEKKTSAFFTTPVGQGVLGVVAAAGGPVGLGVAVGVGAVAQVRTKPQVQVASGGGSTVGLSNILGGVQGILGTTSGFGGTFGAISKIGSGFLSGFLPAQGPVAGRAIVPSSQPQAIQVMGGGPLFAAATTARSAIAEFVAPALALVSQTLGKNVTLRAAMIIIRRLGKFLVSPEAVAAAIGLSIGQMSTILVANSIVGSGGKRMNVGNVKALRRAHRRIRGFHRLCADNDELKRPRRRSAARKAPVVICK